MSGAPLQVYGNRIGGLSLPHFHWDLFLVPAEHGQALAALIPLNLCFYQPGSPVTFPAPVLSRWEVLDADPAPVPGTGSPAAAP